MTAATVPVRYAVVGRRDETADTATLTLAPLGQPLKAPAPGQFMMLTAFGVGEVPISVSGGTNGASELVHTVRAVGAVTRALHRADRDTVVGVRGPFGTAWDAVSDDQHDLVFIAGGIGLAPLRPAIWAAIHTPNRHGRVVVLVGARTPDDLLFPDDLSAWTDHPDVALTVTVDHAEAGWRRSVGVVTTPLRRATFDPSRATAFVCGPEVMMRVVARDLLDRGMAAPDIRLSLERNMRCGIGHCGHCQLGPLLICTDGPVVRLDQVASLLGTKEL
jgi:NAD(P)H-flavin reductase